jgi:hypothetical protein
MRRVLAVLVVVALAALPAAAGARVLFDASQLPQLRLDAYSFGMGAFDHAPGNGDVFFEGKVRGVDHYRRIETGIDAIITGLFVTVIEMYSKNKVGVHLFGGTQDRFQHDYAGIGASAP